MIVVYTKNKTIRERMIYAYFLDTINANDPNLKFNICKIHFNLSILIKDYLPNHSWRED